MNAPWSRPGAEAAREVERLRAEIDRLRLELEEARRELNDRGDRDMVQTLRQTFGLRPMTAEVLAVLYRAKGALRSAERINLAVPRHIEKSEERTDKMASVYVRYIRVRLGQGAVQTEWSGGYRLTAAGVAMVDAALARAGLRR